MRAREGRTALQCTAAATRKNRNIFAEISRRIISTGPTTLPRRVMDTFVKVRRNGEAFYGGAIICVHLSGKY